MKRFLRWRRSERGAVFVMTVPVLILSMAACALSVDIGRQVVEKRADQSVADLAALDAARAVGQYPPGTAPATLATAAQNAAVTAAGRNGFGATSGETVQATLGTLDAVTGAFTPTGTSAVQVLINSAIDYFFLPGSRDLTARAVARVGSPEASFSVGSALASLDTKKSRLDPMLRPMLGSGSLSLVSYDGLATGTVSLRVLREKLLAMGLNVGTPEQLMNADLTLVQLITATGQALGQTGQPTAQAEIDDLLAASITTTNTVKLGDFITLAQPASDAALDAGVNVYQLVSASAQVANGGSFVDVPLTGINLGSLTGVTLMAKVIEPAQVAIGPIGTTAQNSQVTLRVTVDVPLGFLLPTATVTLDYTSANAAGVLSAVACGVASPGVTVDASTSAVAISGTATVPTGTMTIWSTLGATGPTPIAFDHPSEFAPYYEHIGVGTVGLNTSSVNVSGGAAVAPLVPVLQGLLPGVLATLNTSISPAIQPVLASLGLNIAAADLTAMAIVPAPTTCGGPPRLAQ